MWLLRTLRSRKDIHIQKREVFIKAIALKFHPHCQITLTGKLAVMFVIKLRAREEANPRQFQNRLDPSHVLVKLILKTLFTNVVSKLAIMFNSMDH